MASTPTAGKQPIRISLTYNNDGTVTSIPPAVFKKGDLVEFVSDTGGDVYVKLNPMAYSPPLFTPHSGPVKVIADRSVTTSPALCGFVTQGSVKQLAYGWLPHDTRAGLAQPPLPMSGVETDP